MVIIEPFSENNMSKVSVIVRGTSIKINNKMGNIEIRQTRRRSTSIFGRKSARSRSPFQQVIRPNSPYYQDFSPIKYERSPRMEKTDQQKQIKNKQLFFRSPRPTERDQILSERKEYIKREDEWRELETSQLGSENRQKCEQIIRKVRNFNDFLIELKQRLEDDCTRTSDNTRQPRGEVSMNVKLENERVELAKYKKLVERQLSKTHSIQHISIQSSGSGEKILTIQYENLNQLDNKLEQSSASKEIAIKDKQTENHTTLGNGSANKKEEMGTICHQLTIGTKMDRMREAQALWEVLKKKTIIFDKILSKKPEDYCGNSLTDYLRSKEQTVRMNQLLTNLEQANRHSIETQLKIRALLE